MDFARKFESETQVFRAEKQDGKKRPERHSAALQIAEFKMLKCLGN